MNKTFFQLIFLLITLGIGSKFLNAQCVSGSATGNANLQFNSATGEYGIACDQGSFTVAGSSSWTSSSNIVWTGSVSGTGNQTFSPSCSNLGQFNFVPCIPAGVNVGAQSFPVPSANLNIPPGGTSTIPFDVAGICWQPGASFSGGLPISISPSSGNIVIIVDQPDGSQINSGALPVGTVNSLSPVDLGLLGLNTDPNGHWDINFQNPNGAAMTVTIGAFNINLAGFTTDGLVCGDPVIVNVFGGCPSFISAQSNKSTICNNESFQLTATLNPAGAPNVTYSWTGPGISGTSNLPNPVISGLTNTTCDPIVRDYTLNMTCTNNGSTVVSNQHVLVTQYPNVDPAQILIDNTSNILDPSCSITVTYPPCPNFTINGVPGSDTVDFTSGDNGTTSSFTVSSGGACSVTVNPTVTCLSSCTLATYTATSSCNADGTYSIMIDVTDMGDSQSFDLIPSDGSTVTIVAPMSGITFGPYPNNYPVNIKLINPADPGCNQNLGNFNEVCIACPSLTGPTGIDAMVCSGDLFTLTATVDQGVINTDYTIQWYVDGVPAPGGNTNPYNLLALAASRCSASILNITAELTCLNGGIPGTSTINYGTVTAYPTPEYGIDFIAEQCSAVLIDNCDGTLSLSNGGATSPSAGTTTTINYTAAVIGAPASCTTTGTVVVGCPQCSENPGNATSTATEVCWGENFNISSVNSLVVRQGFEVGLAVSTQPIVNVTNTADLLAKADVTILGPYASPGSINPAEVFTNNGGVLPAPTAGCGDVYYFTPFVSFSDITASNSTFNFPNQYVTVPALDIDIFNPGASVPGLYSGNILISGLAYCEGLSNYTINLCVIDEECDGCDLFADPATVLGITLANTGAGITSPFGNINYGNGNHGSHGDGMDGTCLFDPSTCTSGSQGNYVQTGWTSDPNRTINLLAVNACFTGGFIPVGTASDFSYQASATMTNAGTFNFPTVCPSCNAVGQSVAVKILPNGTISAPTAPSPICAGESLDLASLNPSIISGTTGEFEWSQNGTPLTSTIVSPASTTQYCVSYKFCETLACNSNSQCINLVVNQSPALTEPTLAPICPGESVDFVATESMITGLTGSFEWYIGNPETNGALLTDATNVVPLGSEIYCALFTQASTGCSEQICFPANYNSLPILFTVTPQLCTGNLLDLADYQAALNPNPGTWTWYDGDPFGIPAGTVISNTNLGLVEIGDNGATYYVQFTDATTGCTNNSSITITVNDPPIIATPTPTSICFGDSIDLTDLEASITGATGSFEWYNTDPALAGSAPLATDVDGNILVTPANPNTYWAVFTDDATSCSSTTSFSVPFLPTPILTDISPVIYCANSGPYNLVDLEADISLNNSFVWYDDNPTNGGVIIADPTAVIVNNNDIVTFWFVVTNTDNCSIPGSVSLQVYEPVTGATATYDCATDALLVDLTTTVGGSGAGYVIDVSSTNTNGEQIAEGGNYSVIVSDSYGCLQTELTGTVDCISDCFAYIGTVIAPPATICEGEQLIANTIPPDYIPSNADATLSAYYFVVTWDHDNDPLTPEAIEGFSQDGSYDFSTLAVGDHRCFTAFTYDQGWVDELTCNPANVLLAGLGIPCGATLPEIFANPVVAAQIGNASIGDALAGLNTLCGLVTCPPNALCFDYSENPYCVDVVSCGCTSPSGYATANCSPTPIAGEYYIDLYINDFGAGNSAYTITNSATAQSLTANAVGSYQLGPFTYVDGTQVVSITVTGVDEPGCIVQYNVIEKDCTCPAVAGHFTGVSDIACTSDAPVAVNLSMPTDAEYPGAVSMNYDIIVTDPNDNDGGTAPEGKILGFTELGSDYYMTIDGTISGTPLSIGEGRCFYGVIYDQDVVNQFLTLNPLIGSVLGVPAGSDLPVILNAVLSSALVSGLLPAKDVPSLLGGLSGLCGTQPIPGVTIQCPPQGLCLDYTIVPQCVTVADCSATCTSPIASFTSVCNTGNTTGFFVDINTTSLGTGNSSYTVTNSLNTSTSTISSIGTTQVGPFANGSNVTITITGNTDPTCGLTSLSLTNDCAVPTCTNPTASFSTTCNTGNTTGYFVNINTTSMGTGNSSYTVSNNLNTSTSTIAGVGTTQIGPFANGSSVVITLTGTTLSTCTVTSNSLSSNCTNPTCTNPTASFSTTCNTGNTTGYFVNINTTSMGTGNSSYTVSNNLNTSTSTIAGVGTTQIGPFANGSSVVVSLTGNTLSSCGISSNTLSNNCAPIVCNPPSASFSTSCVTGTTTGYYATVNVTNLGSGNSSYTLTNNLNTNTSLISSLGSVQVGPFPNNSNLTLTLTGNQNSDCAISSINLSNNCTIPCIAPTVTFTTQCNGTSGFHILTNIVGGNGNYTITNNINGSVINVTSANTLVGPFLNDQNVLLTVHHSGGNGCNVTSPVLSLDCFPAGCTDLSAGSLQPFILCNTDGGQYYATVSLYEIHNAYNSGGSYSINGAYIDGSMVNGLGAAPGTYTMTYTIVNPDLADGTVCPDNSTSTEFTIMDCNVTAPEISISDPCSCDTYNESTGMFGEQITITGPSGQVWTLSNGSTGLYDATGTPLSTVVATETATGSGIYILNFFTMDNQGFSASFNNNAGLTSLSISSTGCNSDDCSTPSCGTVSAGTLSPVTLCNASGGNYPTAVNLSTLLSGSATAGGSFTSNAGNVINGILYTTGESAGNYTLTYTVINPDLIGMVCPDASSTSTITVINCEAACTAPNVNFSTSCISASEYIVNASISGGNGAYSISNTLNSVTVNAVQGSNIVGPFAVGSSVVVTVSYIGDASCNVSSGLLSQGCAAGGASLSSIVFIDENEDGLQNNGEPGLDGVLVTLIAANGNINTTSTSGGGSFSFANVSPGDGYILNFQLPTGYSFTIQGATGGINSDVNPTTGNSIGFTLVSGYNAIGINAGVIENSPCNDFIANFVIVCNEDYTEYEVVLAIGGGDAGNNGYAITSTIGYNGIVDGSFTDGPFPSPNPEGFTYTVTVVDHPSCTKELVRGYIECLVTPVNLISFKGEVLPEGNLLLWATGSEENNHHFELEKSYDGQNFESFQVVEGHNNSNTVIEYAQLDKMAANGITYYRLKMVSLDGEYQYSEVIALERKDMTFNHISIMPIPAQDAITVSYSTIETGITHYQIVDISGRLIHNGSWSDAPGVHSKSVNIQHLSNGTYFLLLTNAQQNQVARFIKE